MPCNERAWKWWDLPQATFSSKKLWAALGLPKNYGVIMVMSQRARVPGKDTEEDTQVPEPPTSQPGDVRHSGPVKSQRSRMLNTHTTLIPQPPWPSLLANEAPAHTRTEVEKAATAWPSRDLDWRLLVGTQERHIGDTDKSPFLAGPESDDWTLFGYL